MIAGVQVSRIGLGTWEIGGLDWGAIPDEVAITTCLGALERGINLIDTAPIYGHGRSEEIIGKAMRAHGRRDAFYIATKAGLDWSESGVFSNSTPATAGDRCCFVDFRIGIKNSFSICQKEILSSSK